MCWIRYLSIQHGTSTFHLLTKRKMKSEEPPQEIMKNDPRSICPNKIDNIPDHQSTDSDPLISCDAP